MTRAGPTVWADLPLPLQTRLGCHLSWGGQRDGCASAGTCTAKVSWASVGWFGGSPGLGRGNLSLLPLRRAARGGGRGAASPVARLHISVLYLTEGSGRLHFDLTLASWPLPSSWSVGKAPPDGNRNYPLQQRDCPRASKILPPEHTIRLTFTAHPHAPGVGLTEISPFPVSLPLVSLSLEFGGAELGVFGALEPGASAPRRPAYALLQ